MSRPIQPVPESDVIDVERYVLKSAALDLSRSERQMAEAVDIARSAGMTWDEIGHVIDMPADAARMRFAPMRRSA